MQFHDILTDNALDALLTGNGDLSVYTPIDNSLLGTIASTPLRDIKTIVEKSNQAFKQWRLVPAPRRGELVRLLGDELRQQKEHLGKLVSLETGKIYQEGLGEVQEMIDICDFACGLSRQLYGLTIASERPGHRMMEVWHPLGPCGIITAFNFPVAVWAWNTALALVCGNTVIWKPSEKTPLTALACMALFKNVLHRFGDCPDNLCQIVIGTKAAGDLLVNNNAIPLISATGSCKMGRDVGAQVAARFGRSILELGGNNAMIVTPSADLDLAVRAILFSAVGTCGQRCTSLRRLIVHNDIYDTLLARLKQAYKTIPIGSPLDEDVLMGPLVDQNSLSNMQDALSLAQADGGVVFSGEPTLKDKFPNASYTAPAIVEMPSQTAVVKRETFAPILYVIRYSELSEAIDLQNDVPQGLSSCIFTNDIREAETFLSSGGSDCGIANVNIGPSGAEIGGAFGGEKETGGGRESGSDSWKAYMRRATNTVNYSTSLPLAQGISFDH